MRSFCLILIPTALFGYQVLAPQELDFDTRVGLSTFRVRGPSKNGAEVKGTGFMIGVENPAKPGVRWPVLVTAAHVVKSIEGDHIVVDMRRRRTPDPLPVGIQMRSEGKHLYVVHPTDDVAAMFVSGVWDAIDRIWINYEQIAGDEFFAESRIHAGENIRVMGFPRGIIANESMPVVRSGVIASLLVPPTVKHFVIDSRIFPGDSGGVVYMNEPERTVSGKASPVTAVLGIHIGHFAEESANLGNVLSAEIVRQTIQLLAPLRKANSRR